MDDHLELTLNVVRILNLANRKICSTLPRNTVENRKSSYAPIRILARKNEDDDFEQIVCVKYTLEEVIYLLDVMISKYDIKPNCIFP